MSAALPYVSGDFAVARPVSQLVFSEPFPGVNIEYVLTQSFMQFRADWSPIELNTPHPQFTEFLLVLESPLEDQGGGVVKWTRTYAKVPASYSEPGGNYAYNFIGFFGQTGTNVTNITGRDRFTWNVPVTVQRDFFLVDAATPTDFQVIPVIERQRYYFGSNPNLDVDFVGDSPPLAEATHPSRTEYEALITAQSEIVVETSRLSRWMGNIYVRETLYVKAL